MRFSAYYLLNAASIINIYDINYYKRNQYSTYLCNPLHYISAMIDMIYQLMDRSVLILPFRINIIPSHVSNNIFNSPPHKGFLSEICLRFTAVHLN